MLLAAALLFLTIWPTHFHLHHPEPDVGHDHVHKHVVDMHAYATDMNSQHHEDAQVLKAAPDGVLKNPAAKVLPFLLLGVLLAVLAMTFMRIIPVYLRDVFIPPGYQCHHFPPLRGPPVFS